MKKRGRKPKIYPQSEIDRIVYRFTQEEKGTGWIKYLEVYRFSKKLYEKGEIPYNLSEDFWRRDGRQGRTTIDRVNKLYEITLENKNSSNNYVIIDTEECVNKYYTGKLSDKRRLIEALKINEKKARDSNKLLTKLEHLKVEITDYKAQIKELEYLIENYQKVLFSWFNASLKSDVPLINLMTTGKTRHPIVDLFFETVFSNPIEGYEKFDQFRKKSLEKETSLNNNVVTPIRKSRLQQITEQYNQQKE